MRPDARNRANGWKMSPDGVSKSPDVQIGPAVRAIVPPARRVAPGGVATAIVHGACARPNGGTPPTDGSSGRGRLQSQPASFVARKRDARSVLLNEDRARDAAVSRPCADEWDRAARGQTRADSELLAAVAACVRRRAEPVSVFATSGARLRETARAGAGSERSCGRSRGSDGSRALADGDSGEGRAAHERMGASAPPSHARLVRVFAHASLTRDGL